MEILLQVSKFLDKAVFFENVDKYQIFSIFPVHLWNTSGHAVWSLNLMPEISITKLILDFFLQNAYYLTNSTGILNLE